MGLKVTYYKGRVRVRVRLILFYNTSLNCTQQHEKHPWVGFSLGKKEKFSKNWTMPVEDFSVVHTVCKTA